MMLVEHTGMVSKRLKEGAVEGKGFKGKGFKGRNSYRSEEEAARLLERKVERLRLLEGSRLWENRRSVLQEGWERGWKGARAMGGGERERRERREREREGGRERESEGERERAMAGLGGCQSVGTLCA
jgi:hypothetical protein